MMKCGHFEFISIVNIVMFESNLDRWNVITSCGLK